MARAGEQAQGNITVRELRLDDMPRFLEWGHHEDTRFLHYNFPDLNPEELEQWYHSKKITFWRWIYIAEDAQGHLLGYMTVKNIQYIFRRAELGIVFDPARVGQGYGTAALKEFLKIFFYKHKMREMWLRVASFNHRAKRSYEKVGFVAYKVCREPFEEQGRNFQLVLEFPQDFFMEDDTLYATFHRMKLTRSHYESLYGK